MIPVTKEYSVFILEKFLALVPRVSQDAGMDIDKLVNDPMMESSMDSDAKEVVVLLRRLLALWPKK